jgi:hypothetical protein
MISAEDKILIDRINKHPHLKDRFESLLGVIENTQGQFTKADDAEQYVIEEIRKIGNVALHSWAGQAVNQATAQLHTEEKGIEGNGKKKSGGIPLSVK